MARAPKAVQIFVKMAVVLTQCNNVSTYLFAAADCDGVFNYSSYPGAPSCTTIRLCLPGEGQIQAPTSSSDRVCAPCISGTNFSSSPTGPCSPTSLCASGTYQSVAATASSDRECDPCGPSAFRDASISGVEAPCTPHTACGGNEAEVSTLPPLHQAARPQLLHVTAP